MSLSASSIELGDNHAFITYHKRGNEHKGALEIINITNPEQPNSLGFVPFAHADINAVEIDIFEENIVWVAGSSQKIGSALYRIEFTDNYEVESLTRVNLSKKLSSGVSASANGIYITHDYILFPVARALEESSRLTGAVLNQFLLKSSQAQRHFGQSVKWNCYYASLKVNAGNELIIKRADTDELVLNIGLGSSTHQTVDLPHDGKYDLQFSPINPAELYITNASNGAMSVNIVNGQIIKNTHEDMLPKGNSNAVFVDSNFIYMANGEDGLVIAELETAERTNLIQPIFHWDLPEKPASVNFVTAKDGYVYVAKV